MIEILKSTDQSFFLFLNGLHCSFLDPVMYYGTRSIMWLPLYLFILYMVTHRYKWQAIWVVAIAALMIIVSDQLSNFVKEWVARPRPTHEPGLTGIHILHGYTGGQYGFYSAHASTNLAIALFLVRMLKNQYRYFAFLIICWALFMAYTRVYLGVHYPGDIVAGWLAGGVIGWSFGLFCKWIVAQQPDRQV